MGIHIHRWEYLASFPPLASYAYQYDGALDILKCSMCGKLKRKCLFDFDDEKRIYVDDHGRRIAYP